jgi:hypothetical protein
MQTKLKSAGKKAYSYSHKPKRQQHHDRGQTLAVRWKNVATRMMSPSPGDYLLNLLSR